ncbi:hypothetical protein Bbelb_290580 [Branchiostoma belcheri]|nr:hypothetical protein Bbelb_290580 [Branchiostoma belcheri]
MRHKRRWWVRPWLMHRPVYGQYESLMTELCHEHHCDFKSFLRMDPQMFHDLLQRVGPSIEKSPDARQPLSSCLKLAITLRFLKTGNSYRSLESAFRVAHMQHNITVQAFSVDELRQNNVYDDAWRGYGVLDSNRIHAITEHLAGLEGTPTCPEDQTFKTRVNSCINKKAKTTRYHNIDFP